MLHIIKHKNAFLISSGTVVTLSVLAIAAFGFRQGIDFQGGTLWQFRVREQPPTAVELQEVFASKMGVEDPIVSFDAANGTYFVRSLFLNEEVHTRGVGILTTEYPGFEELSFAAIGPSVGAALRRNAIIAIALVLIGISLYIAFAFRKVSRPVSSWKYGLVTLVTLFHDVLIPAGLLAVLGRFQNVEIDSNFVVALLVVMGFSVHDTIVVFDRIRENLGLDRGRGDFGEVVNRSVNQTLRRSVNTSLTLILVLIALFFVGPGTLSYFILTLLVGVTVGTYSSIFIASPGLLLIAPQSSVRKK